MQKPAPTRKIRVLLVDDHMAIRMGLMTAIGDAPDMEVVADAEDGDEGIEAFRRHRPDVVIVDLRMQGTSGVALIRSLREEFGTVAMLVYSNYARGEEIYQAIHAGASGVVLKDMPLDHLLAAIRTVYSGEQYMPTQVAAKVGERLLARLSQREMEVLRLLATGMSNCEIADRLGLVVGTVKIYVANIFSKLGVSDRTQALVTAVRRGIIDIE
jgi:DNA-binding NarL/FixJ family response regulator